MTNNDNNNSKSNVFCPLLLLNNNLRPDEQVCLKERCAWYDKEYHRCALLSISRSLDRIGSMLDLTEQTLEHLNDDGVYLRRRNAYEY